MSETDSSYKHQCFIPHQDFVLEKRNCPKTSVDVKSSETASETNSEELTRCYSDVEDTDTSMTMYLSMADRHPRQTSKFLDWLSECFWKCSPGCQELPTMK